MFLSLLAPLLIAAPPSEGRIMLWLDETIILLKPDGTKLPGPKNVEKANIGVSSGMAVLSPDGKRIAFARADGPPIVPPVIAGVKVQNRKATSLYTLDLATEKITEQNPQFNHGAFYWRNDSKSLFVMGSPISKDGTTTRKGTAHTLDLESKKLVSVQLPENFVLRAVAPNDTMLLEEYVATDTTWKFRPYLMKITDKQPMPLLDYNMQVHMPRAVFSPDGRYLLCRLEHYGRYIPNGNGIFTFDDFKRNDIITIELATGKQTLIRELGETPEWAIIGLAWAPAGDRIAYIESKRNNLNDRKYQYRVVVAGTDGNNRREIYFEDGPKWLVGFDWR
jgi:hypothetical protein